jgi:hypothetical protein
MSTCPGPRQITEQIAPLQKERLVQRLPERLQPLLEGPCPRMIARPGDHEVLLQVPAMLCQIFGGERRRDREARCRPRRQHPARAQPGAALIEGETILGGGDTHDR